MCSEASCWFVSGLVAVIAFAAGCADETTQAAKSNEAQRCGNGRLEQGELCDDGNVEDGDGCPANCQAYCGDGITSGLEECDDGNAIDGDGCSHCRVPGSVLWKTFEVGCGADLGVSPNGDIRATCQSPGQALLVRFPVVYAQEEMERVSVPSPFNPAEAIFSIAGLVETPNAIYTVAQVNSGTGTDQSRARVCKLDPAGSKAWCNEITTYPGGKDESPEAIAVNASGTVAVVGTAAVTATTTGRFVALLDDAGNLLRRTELAGVAAKGFTRAVIDDTARVLVVGQTVDNGVTVWGVDGAGTAAWSATLGSRLEVVDLRLISNSDAEMLVLQSTQQVATDITTTGFTTMQYSVALQDGTLSSKRVTGPAMASSDHKLVRYAAAPSNYLAHITSATMVTAYDDAGWSPWHFSIETPTGKTLVSSVSYGSIYCSLLRDNRDLSQALTCYLTR